MSAHQLSVIYLIQLLILLLPAAGLQRLFQKAGIAGWKAWIPLYNTWIMEKLAGRPRHWVWWQLIPIVGWFISMGILVEFVKLFGKFWFYEHALAAILPVIYFPFLAYDKKTLFTGPGPVRAHKKSVVRDWVDAAVFAVIAATLIRTFVFEAYVIPSGSMEKTQLINDYLFVSKWAYGPRLPNSPLAIPFVHNTLPLFDSKSYVEWIHLPYIRWFASPVKRDEIVVFNFPVGDTVINLPDYQSQRPYYDVCRELGNGNVDSGRLQILHDPAQYPLIFRPVDKEENFIKRCVAIPGDTIQIKQQVIYINGKAQTPPPDAQTFYLVQTKGQPLDEDGMKENYNIDIADGTECSPTDHSNEYRMLLTYQALDKMKKDGMAQSIEPIIDTIHEVFPYSPLFHWTIDDYGPLFIPKKGSTIPLTPENYALYQRAIRVYEGNELTIKDGKYYINGAEATSYTFRTNYYWMMGDNRHNSLDARAWGFVPEDHIVGRASFIWMSWGKGVGIRWNRLFKWIR